MSSPRRFVRQPGGIRVSTIVPGCAHAGPCGGSPGPFPDSITASFGSPLGACAGCSSIGTITLTHSPGDCLSYVGTFSNGCDTYSVLLSYTATSSNPAQHWVLNIQAPSPASCANSGFAAWEAPGNTFAGTIALQNTGTGTDGCCDWPTTIFIDVPDCIGGGGKPCCCGGQPPPPCFHVCIKNTADGCAPDGVDVRMCLSSTNPLTYTGSGSDASGNNASATLTYNPAAPSFTLTYTCNNGSPKTQTFTPSAGWSKADGAINLSYVSGDGSTSLTIGPGPQCLPKFCTICCGTAGIPLEFDVDLGPGGWTTPPVNGVTPFCSKIKGVYTATWLGGGLTGDCSTWQYGPGGVALYDEYCGDVFCNPIILVSLKSSPCRWQVLVHFACTTVADTLVLYESAAFDLTKPCYGSFTLNKISESGNTGVCGVSVCNGSMPDTITISGVV